MTGRRPTSVLIVDDQRENLLALEAVLRPLGLNTVRASSGEEALRRLLADDFACILLDVQMPSMDGFETAQFIKRRERTAHIPIIFLTAIDKEQRQVFRGYSVGAVDYLFKPFEPDVLRSKVQTFVDLYEKNTQLRESEERFRTAFANAPIGIGLLDVEGRWIETNNALGELLGYSHRELVGRQPWELAHRDDATAEREGFERMLRGDATAYAAEVRYRHKDGSLVYLLLSLSLAHGADGEPRGGIWQVVDITGRRRAETERAERIRQQAARAEAEAVADTIQKLQRVTDAALAHLALDDLPRELARHIGEILDVEAAAIYLVEEDGEHLSVGGASGLAAAADTSVHIPIGESPVGRVAADGEPVILDVGTELSSDPLLEPHDIKSLLAVPLVVEQRVSGVLVVASTDPGRRFGMEDQSLLQLIADRAALAIDHARLYQRELGIVETLQRSLLPDSLPQVPGLVTAARYMPGGAGADVGGDWYDAIALENGRLGLAMGDVVGHGIGAAALMGQLRNALRAYALDGHSPSAVVERLDRMVQNLESGRMATLCYMVIEPDLGSLSFSSAGHLPPLVLGPNGDARYLEGGRTLPLGVLPSADYPEAQAELEPGSTLVMYTDGLVEERGASIDTGLDTLKQAVADGPREPEELCDHVVGRLLAHREATDDIAVLAVRTVPMSTEQLHIDLPTDPRSLGTLRRTVGRWLEPLGTTREESSDIQVCCHEACSNAMEHGYRFREAMIDVDASFDGELVEVRISDHGGWRERQADDRGRGLDLIRALMDELDVDHGERGTTVTMRKRLASPAALALTNGGAKRRSVAAQGGCLRAIPHAREVDSIQPLASRLKWGYVGA